MQADPSPYRAPELLFSPRLYDAPAIDLWSAGVALAEFFRPAKPDTDSDSDEDEFHDAEMDPLDDPHPASPAPLFDASFGEIGLAASIFKRLGTPTAESWPVSCITNSLTADILLPPRRDKDGL